MEPTVKRVEKKKMSIRAGFCFGRGKQTTEGVGKEGGPFIEGFSQKKKHLLSSCTFGNAATS